MGGRSRGYQDVVLPLKAAISIYHRGHQHLPSAKYPHEDQRDHTAGPPPTRHARHHRPHGGADAAHDGIRTMQRGPNPSQCHAQGQYPGDRGSIRFFLK